MADKSIFDRLKQDHNQHRELIKKLVEARGEPDRREKLFEQFKVEITAHAAAEEETLYSTMLANPDLREDAQHSVSEHKELDDYLEELEKLPFESAEWEAVFGKLKKRYLHHIEEEEEEMFPDAAEELSDADEKKLAKKFAERKPKELARAETDSD